jgi:GntR family transcriptional regulator, transcriptional repressor for pyruvate dehydrogenase complex
MSDIAQRRSLADRVARQLEALVIENALQAGDLLPPERELCEMLGVSRTVVREAVRSLVAKGLLEVRQGRGTMVRSPDVRLATEVVTNMLRSKGAGRIAFPRVHEVRRLLEVEIAGIAAGRRTEDDLREIGTLLDRTAEASEPETWAAADVAFHQALAEATHNLLFPVLLGSMAEILTELRLTAARLSETQTTAQKFHVAIFEAVRDKSPVAARRAMREHMAEAEATFQRARIASAVAGSVPPVPTGDTL